MKKVLIRMVPMFNDVENTRLKNYENINVIQITIIKFSFKEISANVNEKKREPPNEFGHYSLSINVNVIIILFIHLNRFVNI